MKRIYNRAMKSDNRKTNIIVGIAMLIGFVMIFQYFGIAVLKQRFGLNQASALGSSMVVTTR